MSTKSANRKFRGDMAQGFAGKTKACGWFSWALFLCYFLLEKQKKVKCCSVNGIDIVVSDIFFVYPFVPKFIKHIHLPPSQTYSYF